MVEGKVLEQTGPWRHATSEHKFQERERERGFEEIFSFETHMDSFSMSTEA